MSLTATEKKAGWTEIPFDFGRGGAVPSWVYQLNKGDELLKSDGRVCYFDRAMQKNIAFIDDKGKGWRGKAWGFKAWRRGNPANVAKIEKGPSEYVTDPDGARQLRPGDVALFMLSERRIYIAHVEGTPNVTTISARDLTGKRYRYPLDSFVTKLPADKFPR